MSPVQNYVNGHSRASATSEFITLIDPATGQPDGLSPISTTQEVDEAMTVAAAAFQQWRRTAPSQRQLLLLQLADAIAAHRDELARLQSRDTGQPLRYVLSEEIDQGVDQLRFFAGAARLLEGKSSGEYLTGYTSSVRREPIGVVAQVTPWNYPFAMAIWKIAPALAAGNTIVLKPSDTTPRSTVRLAQIAGQILPAGVLNVINGDASTGRVMVEHNVPALVAITGSVRAGIEVATAAAARLKRTHLELGGKAPAIVMADCDIAAAAAGIAAAAFFNAGQDCTAATRALVDERVYEQFVDALVKVTRQIRPGPPEDEDADYGPLNNAAHLDKVSTALGELPDHAHVLTGGHRVDTEGFFFAPTVIAGVDQNDAIVQNETFGPVLTVQPFTTAEHAISMANDVAYGLAASIWTKDHGMAERLTRELDFGCVWINTHLPFVSEMPHGGFGASGYGKDLSGYSLEDYTRIKHVMSAHY
ncbi:aminobutyraldehyde dehydrogenase [Mycobacteroides salmoniphilum]|uniref:Salicylaldehyde dehydrogenase n=1 Tax=Mycobacteroides salmoniphilum TaxID=404941 RepID=A0A4R8SDL4_9MYCO|nr:aminobutyraldehyde dehydrogenase [Mycobacteroides salmoniphilum]TDZ93509.1 Gamma-aminobutyraldehyde dehydrogenase [Mycobacteroides salmoniphilum]TEA09292.1 Gamma-aminobutyraldehyde dehydrogenase [Mycobacteroides salmoniphilum]